MQNRSNISVTLKIEIMLRQLIEFMEEITRDRESAHLVNQLRTELSPRDLETQLAFAIRIIDINYEDLQAQEEEIDKNLSPIFLAFGFSCIYLGIFVDYYPLVFAGIFLLFGFGINTAGLRYPNFFSLSNATRALSLPQDTDLALV